jgi:hypothetical protein
MDAIIQGAVLGAFGGALGAAVAWVLEKLARRKLAWTKFLPMVGVAIAVAAGRSVLNDPTETALRELDQIETVAALKAHYPQDYELLQRTVRNGNSSASAIELQNSIRPIIAAVVQRQAPKASPDNAYDMMKLAADEATALKAVDPKACVVMASGAQADIDLSKVITGEVRRRDFEVTSRLLTQAATNPYPPAAPLNEKEAIDFAMAALNQIDQANRSETIALLDNLAARESGHENELLCDFYLAANRAVLSQPKAIAGPKVRSLMATK